MKVKATVSFAGEISMHRNQVADIDEKLAEMLIACGYLEPIVLYETTDSEDSVTPEGSDEFEGATALAESNELEDSTDHDESNNPEDSDAPNDPKDAEGNHAENTKGGKRK